MRTFFTTSSLAVLSAVVFAWYLVITGDEIPRRSADFYPPMVTSLPEPNHEVPSIEKPPGAIADIVTPEVSKLSQDSDGESATEAVEEVAVEKPVRQKRIYFEPYGPPAPFLPFVLNINAAEEGVSLQGSIPTRNMKEEITAAIALAFDEEEIDNRLKFSPDTRSGIWITYLPVFVERYFRHTGGNHEMTVVDGKLLLKGAVGSEEAKNAVLKWTKPLQKRGLELDEQVDVDEALKGKLPEIPEKVVTQKPQKDSSKQIEVSMVEEASLKVEKGNKNPQIDETGGATSGVSYVFLAPFDEHYDVHTVPHLKDPGAGGLDSETAEAENESPSKVLEKLGPPPVDDGKPLIFLFDSGSGDIKEVNMPKIDFAINRAQEGRCIIYITGFSDYRGSFEQNQKDALQRANRIKDLIFEGEFDHEVSAEIKTKGDALSRRRPGKETEEQLQRARRVVVEVYHLR